jgi:wyosine [tRNA(Phe)-imidazoG37] synthetase (radical SAM superfamily)
MPLTNERRDHFPVQDILEKTRVALHDYRSYQVDWITIAGSGEPLLYASLGRLIQGVKRMTKIPVAVITNGSLFYLPEVRQDVMAADAILPTVNAGSRLVYHKVNRPHPDVFFERHIEGLVNLRREYSGKLWVEVMLIKGVNDSKEALRDIAAVLKSIHPDEVHLNLPVRPTAEVEVESADQDALEQAKVILGNTVQVARTVEDHLVWHHYETIYDAVLGTINRHPLEEEELKVMLAEWIEHGGQDILGKLMASRKVQVVERHGKRFWCPAEAYYVEEKVRTITLPE